VRLSCRTGYGEGATASLQDTLCRIFEIDGVAGTEAAVVLETFFERPIDPAAEAEPGRRGDSQAMDGQCAR
jgi:hypothetical protein